MDIIKIIREYWPLFTVAAAFISWALIAWLKNIFVSQKDHDTGQVKLREDLAKIERAIQLVETLALELQGFMSDQEKRLTHSDRSLQEINKYGTEPLRRMEEDVRDRLTLVSKELQAVSIRLDFMIKQSRRRDRPVVK